MGASRKIPAGRGGRASVRLVFSQGEAKTMLPGDKVVGGSPRPSDKPTSRVIGNRDEPWPGLWFGSI